MATLTKQQIEEMQSKGLSIPRIKELAQARGFTMPSENANTALKSTFGEKAGAVLGGLGRFTGVEKLGQGIGQALFMLTPEYKDLQKLLQSGQVTPEQFDEIATGNITTGEVVGSAVRTVATVAGAGTLSKGAGLSKPLVPSVAPKATGLIRGIYEGAKTGLKTGVKQGLKFGGISGLATSIEEDKGIGDTTATIAGEAIRGGAIGGIVGGVLGGVTGGIQVGLRNRAQRKFEILEGLRKQQEAKIPVKILVSGGDEKATQIKPFVSGKAAAYNFDDELGKAVKDKRFQTALTETAVPADDLALIKASQKSDYKSYKDMIKIAQSDNVYDVEKPISRVGDTVKERIKFIAGEQGKAALAIDETARTTLSKTIPKITQAVNSFEDDLVSKGIDINKVDKAGNLTKEAFDDSDYADIPGVQRVFNTILKRARALQERGFAAHQLKRFIDEQVEYGKTAEGLTGSADRMVKNFRRAVDTILDESDEAYNKANVNYATAKKARDAVKKLFGKDFDVNADYSSMRAGEVMARILGNASAKPLQAIDELETAARELGGKFDDSVIAQVRFADLLEDITGAPTRSLSGQVERAGKRIANIKEILKHIPFIGKPAEAIRDMMTRDPEERIEALLRYIQELESK